MLIQKEIKCPDCKRELHPTKNTIMSVCPCGEINEFEIKILIEVIDNGS